ncbi:hypothetical protein O9993_22070 [Vibrio lentus]|nr:hypothetical protein [Vibrio lentus]
MVCMVTRYSKITKKRSFYLHEVSKDLVLHPLFQLAGSRTPPEQTKPPPTITKPKSSVKVHLPTCTEKMHPTLLLTLPTFLIRNYVSSFTQEYF